MTTTERLVEIGTEVATSVLRPHAAQVDSERRFPTEGLDALRQTPLMALTIPTQLGGSGVSAEAFSRVLEAIGWGCPSSAMVLLMHSCATAMLAAVPDHAAPLEAVISRGALGTLAQSEEPTGAQFHQPGLVVREDGDELVLDGRKAFVTAAAHADFYLTLVRSGPDDDQLDFVFVERERPGVSLEGDWRGMGLAGNGSITLCFDEVRIPRRHRLGPPGTGQRLLFGTNAVLFLLGIASLNLGIARAAFELAVSEATERRRGHRGERLRVFSPIRTHIATMWSELMGAEALVARAAREQDTRAETRRASLFAAKLHATRCATHVCDRALQVCGGRGYAGQGEIERLYRDARAGPVLGPTTEMLEDWLGRMLLGMPMLDES